MPDLSTTTADPAPAPGSRASTVVRRLALASAATLTAGLVGGLVWVRVAHPAEWEGRNGGLVLTEAAARGQFSVIVAFVLIGVLASIASGWLTAHLVPELGWLAVPVVAVLTTLAALVAWRIGVELGPPDPATVAGVQDGDRVPSQLAVDSVAPFLIWPIFGLAGVIGATWSAGRRDAGVTERFEPRPPA